MSRKTIVTLIGAVFAIAVYWMGFFSGVYYTEQKSEIEAEVYVPTDEEIMNYAIAEKYGQGFYGKLFGDDVSDEWVDYEVYSEDGELLYLASSNRGWYEDKIIESNH